MRTTAITRIIFGMFGAFLVSNRMNFDYYQITVLTIMGGVSGYFKPIPFDADRQYLVEAVIDGITAGSQFVGCLYIVMAVITFGIG